jgi:hypothetical protein
MLGHYLVAEQLVVSQERLGSTELVSSFVRYRLHIPSIKNENMGPFLK